MRFPRLPDWVVYAAIIVAVLFAALALWRFDWEE